MRTIVLVGFPGSGKSTVGKRLASRLSLPFYDTDSFFERKYHLSISDFFSKYGESAFRICEHKVLTEILSFPPCVVATGGGLPCFFNAMSLIGTNAISVYIELSPQSLLDRLVHSKKPRPLLAGKTQEEIAAYIAEELPRRDFFYRQAKLNIKGESLCIDDLVSLIQQVQ